MTAGMSQKPSINIKSIALPVQHGGWGFWLEPTLAGLLLAWSLPGIALGIGGLMVLLLHQPLRVYVKDIRKGKRYERTKIAERFVLLYSTVLLIAIGLTLLNAPDLSFLLPPVLAVPFVAIQLRYEFKNQGRDLIPELAGAILFGAIAPAILLLAHWDLRAALAVWAALAVRSVPAIFYVRARLRLENGKPVKILPVFLVHILGFCVLFFFIQQQALPYTSLMAHTLLTARAMYGLSPYRRPAPAKIIGFQEIGLGIAYIVLLVMGY